MSLTPLEFEVGKARGSCDVYYEPAEYEGIYMFCPEFIEFNNVYIKNKKIPFENINDVLFNIMLGAFKEHEKSGYNY